MQYSYLAALIISIFCMLLIDRRYELAFFHDAKRSLATIAIGTGIFIVWDILGIALGIFFSGDSAFMSGLYLGPEFPVEELLFLSFLCYFTLVTYRYLEARW